jgi:spermidine synthase
LFGERMTTPATTHQNPSQALVLKVCIFTTGLAGIVAEYVMATLASYLLGDAVLQWTLTVSLMLFAMGVGSRLSRLIRGSILDAFVAVELLLSVVCATSATLAYFLSAWTTSMAPIIYGISFAIGLLIGIEIPLATRLNQRFDELRVNISSVLEYDYYGALLGGVLFAFVGLPLLGLTYTPIALGALNLLVAAVLFARHHQVFAWRRVLNVSFAGTSLFLIALVWLAEPIVLFGEQHKYRDQVVYQDQTRYQRIVMTRFRDHHWLYLDGHEQFSSYDEERYHEPLVHPAMLASAARRHILVLGGGDGLALREVLRHPEVEDVTLVDVDPAMTTLGRTHEILVALNGDAFADPRVTVENRDAYTYLRDADSRYWDVILIDLPDPRTIDLARLYSLEFYRLAHRHLSPGGVVVTQATSPFFTRRAFLSVGASMAAAGFATTRYHNHVPTMGEWGWVLGMRGPDNTAARDDWLTERVAALSFETLDTRFLNRDAMLSMLHFGKGFDDEVEVSNEINLAIFYYYRDGDWDLY